jgi:hypothetical protein
MNAAKDPSDKMQFLREQYESLLQTEYNIDPGTYESSPEDLPSFPSLTEAVTYAFDELEKGTGSRQMPNYLWRNLLAKLLSNLPNDSKLKECNIFIGQVPDYSFNAHVIPYSKSDYLILINSGLMLFIFRIASIFLAVHRFRETGGETREAQIDLPTAQKLMGENIRKILFSDHELPIKLKEPHTIKTAHMLTQFIESFVIAHELGHISEGHLHEPLKVEHEFEADVKGYSFYRLLGEKLTADFEDIPLAISDKVFYTAPHLMFFISSVIEHHLTSAGVTLLPTHPPSYDRMMHLGIFQELLKDKFSVEVFYNFRLLF